MIITMPIKTQKQQKITLDEVRLKLREIEENVFSDLITPQSIVKLNESLDNIINIPYGLNIKAEFTNNTIKLFGYDSVSKNVLDPKYKKEFI